MYMLADKIITLRKKNGWSQEELADKTGVSRQAVSKWETSQAFPDVDKILQLSSLFGVTTDYLLKDDITNEECATKQHNTHKLEKNTKNAVMLAYFGMIPVVYVIWSFLSQDWHITWITFILSGIFMPLVSALCDLLLYKRSNK